MCDDHPPSIVRKGILSLVLGVVPSFLACTLAAQVVPPTAPPASTKPQSPPTAPATKPALEVPDGYRVVDSETYPDDPRIDIARRLLGAGRLTEAKIVLDTVLSQKPTLGRAQFFMGTVLSKQKQYEQARPFLEKSIASGEAFPERKHAQHFMGWASYHLGELERAKIEFEAHLAIVADEPDSIFALGLIAFDTDDLDTAEAKFQKAIDLQQTPNANRRDLAKAWARLGDVSMRRDDPAKAEERYMSSLSFYPDHDEVWLKLARSRDRLGKAIEADRAREEAERAKERVAKRTKQPSPGTPENPPPATPPATPPESGTPASPPKD